MTKKTKKSDERSLLVECQGGCGASGLYQGFMEALGEAVICSGCGGSGAQRLRVKLYRGRRKKRGVRRVLVNETGTILTPPDGDSAITYAEFLAKIPEHPLQGAR